MSRKPSDDSELQIGDAKPFFAHLLTGQSDPMAVAAESGGGTAPTYHCLDSPCTKKYPSDDDESTTWFSDRDS